MISLIDGLHRIDLRVTPQDDLGDKDGDYSENKGKCAIRVSEDLPAPIAALTELHEILHYISSTYGVPLSEGRVRALSEALSSLFSQNPAWARSLIKRLAL